MLPVTEKTNSDLIKDTTERLQLDGKVWCFIAGMHPHPKLNQFLLGVAVLGEAGWNPLPKHGFDTYDAASARAEELNKLFPYNENTCIAIVADTMSRSRLQAEENARHPFDREYKVKVSFVYDSNASTYEDNVMDVIRDAIEDEARAENWGVESVEVELK